MDLVDGVPITTWAEQKNLDRGARLSLIAKVCEAMQYAHDHGVIHCDLKPANLLVRRSGEPLIIDFGIAYLREQAGASNDGSANGTPEGPGRGVAGTPAYMSPEQFQGGIHELRAGQSVDVHALGVVTFELLAGQLPYDLPPRPTRDDLRRAILFSSARRLADALPDIDPELDRILAKALRKDPADRYFSVGQFLRALSRFLPASAPATDDSWQPAIGLTIPSTNWVLDEKLGEGGVGEVWICHHRSLKTKRIVKFCADEEKASFLRRELTLYKLLKEKVGQNPHFARLEEVALEEPPRYLMSEFIEARDFAKWYAAHRAQAAIPERAVLEIVAQAADALQAAHDAGVIHRDIKPSNLLLRGDPADLASLHVWVGDFGIGQVLSDDLLGDCTRIGFTRTLLGKKPTSLSGTHLYMAPEMLSGGEASVRSDIYALGVVLYQALAGDFQRALTIDWAADIPDPLLRADLEKCFARDPAARFSSAAQLGDRLRRLPERRQQRDRAEKESSLREKRAYRRGLALAGAVAAAIIALVAGLGWYAYELYREAWVSGSRLRINEMRALRFSSEPDRRIRIIKRAQEARGNVPADHVPDLRNEMVAAMGLKELVVDRSSIDQLLQGERPTASERAEFIVAIEEGVLRIRRRSGTVFEAVADLDAPPPDLQNLAVTDDGQLVVAVGEKELVLWDRATSGPMPVRCPSPTPVAALALHRTGRMAVSRHDGRIEIYTRTNHWSTPLVIHRPTPALGSATIPELNATAGLPWTAPARQMAFDPTGQRLAVVSEASLWATIWSTADGSLVASAAHQHAPAAVAWDAGGRLLAIATEGGEVRLWGVSPNPETSGTHLQLVKQALTTHETEGVAGGSLQFSVNGSELYARLQNGSLKVLEAPGWRQGESREVPSWVRQFVLTADGGAIGLGESNRSILWQADLNPGFAEAFLGGEPVLAVATGFDDRLVAAAVRSRVGLFGLAALDPLGHDERSLVTDIAFHPSRPHLYISAADKLYMWSAADGGLEGGTVTLQSVEFEREKSEAGCHGIVCDNVGPDFFVAFALGAELRLFVNNLAVMPLGEPDPGLIDGVAWCPEAKSVAVAHRGAGSVEFHTVPEHQVSRRRLPGSEVRALASGPGGSWLAVRTSTDIRLLSVPGGEELSRIELRAPSDAVCVAVSRDGSMLAAQNDKGEAVILAVKPDNTLVGPVLTLRSAKPRRVRALTFGGVDATSLIIGTEQGFIQAWQLRAVRDQLADAHLNWSPPVKPPPLAPPKDRITTVVWQVPPKPPPEQAKPEVK
jgi:serine/threonine protein kinase